MTRKDYVALARIIADARNAGDSAEEAMREKIAQRMADMCAADNPRFDKERFLRDCGVKS